MKTGAAWVFSVVLALNGALAFAETGESFGGIGISIESKSGGMTQIVAVAAGGPADRAGVKAGEYIGAVDGLVVKGLSVEEVARLIRGEVGTRVTLTLTDKKGENGREVLVERELIEVKCFMEGNRSLWLHGDAANGYITGYIGNRSVHWTVLNGYIHRVDGGKAIRLWLEEFAGQDILRGWIHNTSVRWAGWNRYWSGYQACIPN